MTRWSYPNLAAVGAGVRASRAGFERGLTFGPVAGNALAYPALGDAVAAGCLGLLAVLEDDSGDDQVRRAFDMPARCRVRVSYLLGDGFPMV